MPRTGRTNRMHTPSSGFVANVSPRSVNDTCAGPITFGHAYGPVTDADSTLDSFVRTTHGPNLATRRSSSSSTPRRA